jgi:predicted porin
MKNLVYPLAMAVLACVAVNPALAQSSVQISGFLDLGVSKKTDGSVKMGTLGHSNLAFSGKEDLGGGLAAIFRLSTRFEIDSGAFETAPAGTRQFWQDESTVGLTGGFGTIRFGRALMPLNGHDWQFDPWYAFDRIASPMYLFAAPDFLPDPGNVGAASGTDLDYTRMSNAVFYDSPRINGVQLHLVAQAEKKTGIDQGRGMAAAVDYMKGPLALMLDYEKNSQDDKLVYASAAYLFGNLRLMGSYSHVKLNPNGSVYGPGWTNWSGASRPTTKRTSMTLGATYAMGPGTVRAGFGRDFHGSTNYFNYIGSTFNNAGTGYSGPTNIYSIGYAYTLSKRTSLIADLAQVKWEFTDDKGRTSAIGYAAGIAHTF